jgi:hypothetical protein
VKLNGKEISKISLIAPDKSTVKLGAIAANKLTISAPILQIRALKLGAYDDQLSQLSAPTVIQGCSEAPEWKSLLNVRPYEQTYLPL